MADKSHKILIMSTPVGAIGSGLGGGVELNVLNFAKELQRRGHQIEIVAPQGSVCSLPITEIPGAIQIPAQNQLRVDPVLIPCNSVLANMWDYARQAQANYDVILNFAYDWLPLYLTSFFNCPIAHFISMSSLTDAMDRVIEKVANEFPGSVAVQGKVQADTFTFAEKFVYVRNCVDVSAYQFCSQPSNSLAWIGRIASEKGLEDAVAASQITGISLKIFGLLQDTAYWQQIHQQYPEAPIEYMGFLPTYELQQHLGKCRALLATPRWIDAYPTVALEAMACGVPVIAYRRGGLAEIVEDGNTGFLVEPDRVPGLVEAIHRLDKIDRLACRQRAEDEYSLEAMGDRLEKWFADILSHQSK
ncbi:glycosyltransferase family 4 protein [Nostoc sp. FACHB-152]|uniref:glycosyltransferase family 4 protein n=1 Tax=unclassified Nostoc TaxID=2593658 RepID=UPI001689B1E6|nr:MULTISPECIES: glycosyltransferase family 4 protein [unclassified Nostoc]MBD2449187.1 glycosyltransferase family 4 protein [Nostoc sp. FACHB-152]MBD2466336.1 glycosyltransferase family 4 protein [Nostoc sp. FACHB-145]